MLIVLRYQMAKRHVSVQTDFQVTLAQALAAIVSSVALTKNAQTIMHALDTGAVTLVLGRVALELSVMSKDIIQFAHVPHQQPEIPCNSATQKMNQFVIHVIRLHVVPTQNVSQSEIELSADVNLATRARQNLDANRNVSLTLIVSRRELASTIAVKIRVPHNFVALMPSVKSLITPRSVSANKGMLEMRYTSAC